jgi:hypothetical protein
MHERHFAAMTSLQLRLSLSVLVNRFIKLKEVDDSLGLEEDLLILAEKGEVVLQILPSLLYKEKVPMVREQLHVLRWEKEGSFQATNKPSSFKLTNGIPRSRV